MYRWSFYQTSSLLLSSHTYCGHNLPFSVKYSARRILFGLTVVGVLWLYHPISNHPLLKLSQKYHNPSRDYLAMCPAGAYRLFIFTIASYKKRASLPNQTYLRVHLPMSLGNIFPCQGVTKIRPIQNTFVRKAILVPSTITGSSSHTHGWVNLYPFIFIHPSQHTHTPARAHLSTQQSSTYRQKVRHLGKW